MNARVFGAQYKRRDLAAANLTKREIAAISARERAGEGVGLSVGASGLRHKTLIGCEMFCLAATAQLGAGPVA